MWNPPKLNRVFRPPTLDETIFNIIYLDLFIILCYRIVTLADHINFENRTKQNKMMMF